MGLFLGVDGGQSTTTALIGDDTGRILGWGYGGPCNHVGASEGRPKLIHAVTDCVEQACQMAGVDPRVIHYDAACFGMSGGPEDKHAILAEILHAERLIVTHDGMIALSGATAGEPGVIVIAGTGSFVYARGPSGDTVRAGGWGYVFGDEGSGFDIARQALRAALRMEEGWGPENSLRHRLLTAAGVGDANELLHRFYTSEYPRPRVARFAKIVDEAAREGDRVALDILHNAAQQLAVLVAAARRQLWRDGDPVLVAHIGGVFRSEVVMGRFRMLVEMEDGIRCIKPVHNPAAGALLEAYRASGVRVELSGVPELKA
ncbi:MAG: BadF/BadG/BcrA/BcrD ATPase family protein [Bryobacteraceae bacterium]